jgi:hypothetical protein
LREDFALSEQEQKENFGLQQDQARDSAADQAADQARALEEQVNEIRDSLAEQNTEFEDSLAERRAALLASFDEEEAALRESQQEQRDSLLENYNDQLEDLRFNRDRQLEDLGRSLVEQEDLTKAGAQAIADELEKAFGEEGVADVIMTGFADRQASTFQQLFNDIAGGIAAVGSSLSGSPSDASTTAGTAPSRRGRQSFAEGGIVDGPEGAPVNVLAHGGEMFLNRGQQNQIARMLAPVIPSQRLTIGGGATFKVDAPTGTSANVVNEAGVEMTQAFDEAVRRLERRRSWQAVGRIVSTIGNRRLRLKPTGPIATM